MHKHKYRLIVGCLLGAAFVLQHLPAALAEQVAVEKGLLERVVQNVNFFRLSNGLRVIMYKRGDAPVFAGAVITRVGGIDEGLGDSGISHMFEHMAFKGSLSVGTKDFVKEAPLLAELEQIASHSQNANVFSDEQKKRWDEIHEQLRALWITDDFSERYNQQGAVGMNATTDKELTKYFVSLPRSAFEFWCRVESERLRTPVLRQFYQERDVVLEERRMRYEVDPLGKVYELLLGSAFIQHPYRTPVIGYEHDIRNLTATKLEAFRQKYYVPSNMVISLVGDIDATRDLTVIEHYFGSLPVRPTPEVTDVKESKQEGERRVSVRAAAAPKVMIAYKKPASTDSEDPAISVMNEILGGSEVSPLYQELVKRKQVASGIVVDEEPGYMFPNLFVFYGEVKNPHSSEDFVNVFDSVVRQFKKNGPTQDDLERAKRSIGVAYLDHLKSNQSIALDLASSELMYNDWKKFFEWYDHMLKVSLPDVRAAAAKYLQDDTRTVANIEPSTR